MPQAKTLSPSNTLVRLRVQVLFGRGIDFEEDNIIRVIEMRAKQTLDKLHEAIFIAFDRFDYHFWDFYFGDDKPYSDKATIYGMSSDSFLGAKENAFDAKKTDLASLGLKAGDTFYYLFDTGDDWWHRIVVESVDGLAQRGGRYPRIVKKIGRSPEQYEEYDEDEDE